MDLLYNCSLLRPSFASEANPVNGRSSHLVAEIDRGGICVASYGATASDHEAVGRQSNLTDDTSWKEVYRSWPVMEDGSNVCTKASGWGDTDQAVNGIVVGAAAGDLTALGLLRRLDPDDAVAVLTLVRVHECAHPSAAFSA